MKMKLIVFLFSAMLILICPFSARTQGLFNGEYTIGLSMNADYNTLTEAADDVRAGTVTGDVIFNIEAGTYQETLDLSSVNSGSFTVTFSGAGIESTIIHPLDNISTDKSGISITNAQNVTLKGVKLIMDDISDFQSDFASNNTKGINISNASNITLDNVSLENSLFVNDEGENEFISSAVSILESNTIYISSSSFSGAGILIYFDDFKDVWIEDSHFQEGQIHLSVFQEADTFAEGLNIDGNIFYGPFPSDRTACAIQVIGHSPNFLSDSFSTDILIENNTIEAMEVPRDNASFGMYVTNVVEPIIRNNTIRNGCDGMFVGGCTDSKVEQNDITGTSNYALRLQNGEGYEVANNILASDYGSCTAVFLSNVSLYHNTFQANEASIGVYLLGVSGDNLDVVNNIFSVSPEVTSELVLSFVQANSLTIDNNLYSGQAATNTVAVYDLGGRNGTTYIAETLEDWQNLQSDFDQNSQSFAPAFVSGDDFHITDATNYRFGAYLSDFTEDIDGDIRNESTGVDVGADQYCPVACVLIEAPEIASFLPDQGPIGSSVTIFGENFDPTPANNTVYFGAIQATVQAASSSELVVSVPPGATYQPIQVIVNGLVAKSQSSFNVTFESDASISEGSFATSLSFETGAEGAAIAYGDLDNDGLTDVVVANATDGNISIFRNVSSRIGDINFETRIDLDVSGNPGSLAIADFDGDSKLDIAVGSSDNGNVSVFRNISSGTIDFDTRQDFSFVSATWSLAVGDLDGDGRLDLAVTDTENDVVAIVKNQSIGNSINFSLINSFPTGDTPVSVAITDVDQDQTNDVVVANRLDLSMSVLLNDGSMNLAPKMDYDIESESAQVISGDLDGDGIEDLIVAASQTIDHPTARIKLFRNTSTPGNLSLTATELIEGVEEISLADANGDGLIDILYSNLFNGLFVMKNTSSLGSFSFDEHVQIIHAVFPFAISSVDLDNDGEADVMLTGLSGNFVDLLEVYRNLNSSTDFINYSLPEQSAPADINTGDHSIEIDVENCTNPSALIADFEIANGGSANIGSVPQVSGSTENDFSSPSTYTVIAEDGSTTQDWLITISALNFSEEVTENVTTCDEYEFDGELLTISGQYQGLFTNQAMCDSLVTLNLTILESTEGSEDVESCDEYEWQGTMYTMSGNYMETLINSNGCDSLATLNLTINSSDLTEIQEEACDVFEFNGENLTSSGFYEAMLTNVNGCDSLVTLDLNILQSDVKIIEESACGSYLFDGDEITESGIYAAQFTNMAGCDSIVDLDLTIYEEPVADVAIDANILFAQEQNEVTYQWIDCATDEAIADATSIEFTPTETGPYAVKVSNENCTVISECIEAEVILSLENSENGFIGLFPNPTTDFVILQLKNSLIVENVEFIGISGQLLNIEFVNVGEDQVLLKLEDIPAGVYVMRLTLDNGRVFQDRIIKK